METKEIIERLRTEAMGADLDRRHMLRTAAARLEQLEQDKEDLREGYYAIYQDLQTRLSQLWKMHGQLDELQTHMEEIAKELAKTKDKRRNRRKQKLWMR